MKRTGVGWLSFAVCLLAVGVLLGGGKPALGQDPVTAEVEAPVSSSPAATEEVVAAPEVPVAGAVLLVQADQRLASLQSADLAALKQARIKCEEMVKELSVKAPKMRAAARVAYEEARLNSAVAKDIHQQIADLQKQLDQSVRELPNVKDKFEEIQLLEQAMLVELQNRTALAGLIAEREQEEPTAASE